MKRQNDKYKHLNKERFKPAHFYCDICGARVLVTTECKDCAIKHIISKFDDILQ